MKKDCYLFPYLFLLVAIAFNPALCKAQQSSFERGKQWYEQRAAEADSFLAKPEYINNAVEAFEQALQENDHAEEAGLYLLKSYYFKGMFLRLDKREQKKVYQKGRELGNSMGEQFPESEGIKFWYAANLGRWAKVHGFFASATSGVAKTLRSLCEKIISLDPTYQGGGGYRILAQVHFYTPDIPLLMSWPSDQKALDLVEKAMEIAPEHPTNRLLYAEILMSFDRNEEATKHLTYITKLEPRPTAVIPDRYVKYRAGELLRKHFEAEGDSK